MPECQICGLEVKTTRGGRCPTCQDLYLKAKAGDSAAAEEYSIRGGELPKRTEERRKLDEAAQAMTVSTEMSVPNVSERLGVVTGQCALGMNIFRDFTAEIIDIVGGRSGAYQKAIKEAKEHCIADMKIEAAELGADAVIAVDLDFSQITGGGGLFGGKSMIMVIATGTAVKLK